MSRIWLDVTTLLMWNRPVVGIVRVESECANFLLTCGWDNVRFCRFDRGTGYEEVAAEHVAAKLSMTTGHGASPAGEPAKESAAGALPAAFAPPVPRALRYKRMAQNLVARLPPRMADRVWQFGHRRKDAIRSIWFGAGHMRAGAMQLARSVRPAARGRPALPPAPAVAASVKARTCPFGPGDLYLSMGLDWDQKDLYYLYGLRKQLGLRVVLFCYDIIPVKFPHLVVGNVASIFARYFADVAWCADRVLCISECSRRDLQALLQELGTPVPEMEVVQLGCSVEGGTATGDDGALARQTGEDFILFVSTIERRKNHITLYHAYTQLIDAGVANLPKLVFVGMRGWGVDDLFADLRYDPRVRDRVLTLHDVSDAQLNGLYDRALFTVFPSLYEGWGLAIGESLARGKFCLASKTASMPEVGGDFVDYIDPLDVPGWTRSMRHYIENRDALAERERDIRERYRPFGWDQASAEIVEKALRPFSGGAAGGVSVGPASSIAS